jgi:exoribonuclease-2
MGTAPAPHEGIGVEHYAWCTSPLRRYVDLVNQRQLVACVRDQTPPYASNDAELFGIVSGFESAYGAYAEFQQKLERYWSLRWLEQEKLSRIEATVLRGDVLRIDGMPFITRLPGLPELPRGQRLELDVVATDHVDLTLEVRVHRLLAQTTIDIDDEELGDAGVDALPLAVAEQSAEAIAEAAAEEAPTEVTSDPLDGATS